MSLVLRNPASETLLDAEGKLEKTVFTFLAATVEGDHFGNLEALCSRLLVQQNPESETLLSGEGRTGAVLMRLFSENLDAFPAASEGGFGFLLEVMVQKSCFERL